MTWSPSPSSSHATSSCSRSRRLRHKSLDDLAAAGADLVIGAEGVPVGDYTREVLDRLPANQSAAILDSVRSRSRR